MQPLEIPTTLFDECGEFFKLSRTDRRLHIGRLQVVAKMRVDIFVIVACGKFAVLTVKSMSAEVVPARRTYAVASPIAEGANNFVQQRVVCIDCAALAHSHVMRRIETRCTDIANSSSQLIFAVNSVFRAECVTVILNEPQTVSVAEFLDSAEIEGISQCMCDHNSLCFRRKSLL